MGSYVTLTFLDGSQSTVFLTSSDLENYLAVGDVSIKYIYPDVPDYVINTLELYNNSSLNTIVEAWQIKALMLQDGNTYTDDQYTQAENTYGGKITVGQYINSILPNIPQTVPTPPGQVEYFSLGIVSTSFVAGKLQVTVQAIPVAGAPNGTDTMEFQIQVIDSDTGKITNNGNIDHDISDLTNAIFNEPTPLTTHNVTVSIFLVDPTNKIQLAPPIQGFPIKVSTDNVTTGQTASSNDALIRDVLIGASLLVGVPLSVWGISKLIKKPKGKKK